MVVKIETDDNIIERIDKTIITYSAFFCLDLDCLLLGGILTGTYEDFCSVVVLFCVLGLENSTLCTFI